MFFWLPDKPQGSVMVGLHSDLLPVSLFAASPRPLTLPAILRLRFSVKPQQ